jgi:hypothetical protein
MFARPLRDQQANANGRRERMVQVTASVSNINVLLTRPHEKPEPTQ